MPLLYCICLPVNVTPMCLVNKLNECEPKMFLGLDDQNPVELEERLVEWGFYPEDITIGGGTNYVYCQTAEEGWVTNKAPRKKAKGASKGEEGYQIQRSSGLSSMFISTLTF